MAGIKQIAQQLTDELSTYQRRQTPGLSNLWSFSERLSDELFQLAEKIVDRDLSGCHEPFDATEAKAVRDAVEVWLREYPHNAAVADGVYADMPAA